VAGYHGAVSLHDVLARYAIGPVLETRDWGGTAGRTLRIRTADAVLFLRRRGPRSSAVERIRFDHGLRRLLLRHRIPTAAPLSTIDGADWVTTAEGVYELYPFVEGRPHRAADQAEIRSLAGSLAAFHLAGAEYRLTSPSPPPFEQFSLAAPGTPASCRIDDPTCLRVAIAHIAGGLRGEEIRAAGEMIRIANQVAERFGGAAYDEMDRYVIHGDLHPATLLFDDKGSVAGIFDLDWATPAPRLRDLADALHFFASQPTAQGSDIWALTAPRRLDTELARLFLAHYHAALPLSPAELAALPWAWIARWLAMHTDGAYKVPPGERGRFLTNGVLESAEAILTFDPGAWLRSRGVSSRP
jgi:Ser/Thr protein kinase RdoA (MazF antagonist)